MGCIQQHDVRLCLINGGFIAILINHLMQWNLNFLTNPHGGEHEKKDPTRKTDQDMAIQLAK